MTSKMGIEEKIKRLEKLCPGTAFTVDDDTIRFTEFGRSFVVARESVAGLAGEWPECWFDYEIERRSAQNAEIDIILAGASHPYKCHCGVCREWWKLMGPDPDTGKYGTFLDGELGLKQNTSIDIYCGRDSLSWVIPIAVQALGSVEVSDEGGYVISYAFAPAAGQAFGEVYSGLVQRIEEYVKENRIGLPWYTEQVFLDGPPSLFLTENIEVSYYIDNRDGTGHGASWSLYDLWYEIEPPQPEEV